MMIRKKYQGSEPDPEKYSGIRDEFRIMESGLMSMTRE